MAPCPGIAVRQLAASDAPQYRVLRLGSLRNFQSCHGPAYEDALEQPVDWHAQRITAPGDVWFGAFDGEQLAGAIALRTQDGSRIRHSASLRSLMVDRAQQGRGIGRLLVAHLIDHARSLGHIRQITLSHTDSNVTAARLYQSFGFKLYGTEPDAVLHEGRYVASQHRQLILK